MANAHRKEDLSFEEILASIRQMNLDDASRMPTPKGEVLANISRIKPTNEPYDEKDQKDCLAPRRYENTQPRESGATPASINNRVSGSNGRAANADPVRYSTAKLTKTSTKTPPGKSSEKTPRQMACCKDTRMAHMADVARVAWPGLMAAPSSASAKTGQAAASDAAGFGPAITATGHGAFELDGRVGNVTRIRKRPVPKARTPGFINDTTSLRAKSLSRPNEANSAAKDARRAPTPQRSGGHVSPKTVAPLSDSTAQLLRPLLMEWVQQNMPRVVETALRKEAANGLVKKLGS